MTVDQLNRLLREADLLASGNDVETAIARMAGEITGRLSDSSPLVITVMNGGLIFAGQLLTRLFFPLETDYLHATRYGDRTRGEELDWIVKPKIDIRGKTVLLLDDILDEGVTLSSVVAYCIKNGAKEVLTAVLVEKLHGRKAFPGIKADFVGIEIEDRFVVGYGLDYKGFWRNAPGIYALKGV